MGLAAVTAAAGVDGAAVAVAAAATGGALCCRDAVAAVRRPAQPSGTIQDRVSADVADPSATEAPNSKP